MSEPTDRDDPAGQDEPAAPGDAPALRPQTTAIRAGRGGSGTSLAPVLWPTTTFVAPTVEDAHRWATTTRAERFYTRYGNPTINAF